MNDWWMDIDRDILECLGTEHALTPGEIGRQPGLSEGAVSSVLSMLVQGKVRICLVALATAAEPGRGHIRSPLRALSPPGRLRRSGR